MFLVRTKSGFHTFFVEASTQKVQFILGSEAKSGPTASSFSFCQPKEFPKIFIGTFNFAEATKTVLTWYDGHQTTHELTNGTLIIEPKNNESELKQWEVFDSYGKSLYMQ